MSAAECALMMLLFPGSVSIRRFLFLIMPRRRDCAKSVRECNSDLNRMKSWALAVWSIVGLVVSLLALGVSSRGRTAEKMVVR